MALPAVSSGAYAVGRVILPIAVDVVATIAMKLLAGHKISPKARWVIATLPACSAVYLTSGVPKWDAAGVITCCFYVAYKAIPYLRGKGGLSSRASVTNPQSKHEMLIARLTIPYDGHSVEKQDIDDFAVSQIQQVRALWKDEETREIAEHLLKEAAAEMDALYVDLESVVSDESSKYEEMAELLTKRTGPNDYFSRFWKSGSSSLLDIYRMIRALKVVVSVESTGWKTLGSIFDNFNRTGLPVEDRDVRAFFTKDTRHYRWRTIYNQAIARFHPIIAKMDKSLEQTKAFEAWTAIDDCGPVAKNDFPYIVFKIFPCPKPI
jgi:hypothetical protein